jgi:hypothetical protein
MKYTTKSLPETAIFRTRSLCILVLIHCAELISVAAHNVGQWICKVSFKNMRDLQAEAIRFGTNLKIKLIIFKNPTKAYAETPDTRVRLAHTVASLAFNLHSQKQFVTRFDQVPNIAQAKPRVSVNISKAFNVVRECSIPENLLSIRSLLHHHPRSSIFVHFAMSFEVIDTGAHQTVDTRFCVAISQVVVASLKIVLIVTTIFTFTS